jgi:hypothetical protein
VRNTTAGACRQRRRIVSTNYASNLRFAAGPRHAPAWALRRAQDRNSTEYRKPLIFNTIRHRLRGPAGGNFLRPVRHFAAILSLCTKIQSCIAQRKKVVRVFEFESSMLKTHKFQIGQTVCFTSRPIGHMAVNDAYLIVKLLPSDGDDYQYRIKSANEAFERVAKESQLDRY